LSRFNKSKKYFPRKDRPEAVFLIDGAPNPVAGLTRVAGEPLGVQGQVNMHTVLAIVV
jgi:hypothetical protein